MTEGVGSLAEVRSRLYVAFDIDYIGKEEFAKLSHMPLELS